MYYEWPVSAVPSRIRQLPV